MLYSARKNHVLAACGVSCALALAAAGCTATVETHTVDAAGNTTTQMSKTLGADATTEAQLNLTGEDAKTPAAPQTSKAAPTTTSAPAPKPTTTTPKPVETTSATPTTKAYTNVMELKDAAVAAGLTCTGFAMIPIPSEDYGEVTIGVCDPYGDDLNDGVFVVNEHSEVLGILAEQFLTPDENDNHVDAILGDEGWFLVAPLAMMPQLQQALGGTVVTYEMFNANTAGEYGDDVEETETDGVLTEEEIAAIPTYSTPAEMRDIAVDQAGIPCEVWDDWDFDENPYDPTLVTIGDCDGDYIFYITEDPAVAENVAEIAEEHDLGMLGGTNWLILTSWQSQADELESVFGGVNVFANK